jgi:phage terminase large subunit
MLRKIRATCAGSVTRLVLDILDKNKIEYQHNKTDRRISFPGSGGRQNEIFYDGLDDPEKIKSISGITGLWLEEATEFTERDVLQLDLRLRGKTAHYKQIMLTFNPVESAAPWLKQKYFDATGKPLILENTTVHLSTIRDNPFIDDEYKAVLKGIDDPEYSAIYLHGKWAVATGVIFTGWKIEAIPESRWENSIYGLDFGYHRTALVQVAIDKDAMTAHMRQLIYDKGMTNSDIIDRLGTLGISQTAEIYADSAEPDRIEEIFRKGYNIHPALKDVSDGIDMMKRFKLIIDENSTDGISELKTYKWKHDKNGQPVSPSCPVKISDHFCDSARYALYSWMKAYDYTPRIFYI